MKTAIIALVVVILLGIFGPQTLYTVDETQITVVRRFGDIKAVNLNPGIQVKAPFIDSVTKLDKRLLRVDIPEATLPDVELQFLVIDAYVRYKIRRTEEDAIKFFEKTRGGNLQIAEDRIERIVVSALREEVAKRQRQEIIGGLQTEVDGQLVVLPTETRQEILDAVLAAAIQATSPGTDGDDEDDLGIDIVDVRMKRADFPDATIENIFTRMKTERELISAGLRAEGAEEAAKITAAAERDRTIILAQAERSANLTRGEGEAKAIQIFADALQEDPEFYAFQRSLEAYKQFLSTNSTVILGSDSELFEFLQDTDFIPVDLPVSIVDVIDELRGNSWTVGGLDVRLSGSTTISADVSPEVGLSVFIEGSSDQSGVFVPSDVLVGAKGIVDNISLLSLTVNNQLVLINEQTDVRAEPRVIATAYVEGVVEGGTLTASVITEGVAGSVDVVGEGFWTIGGTNIAVGPDTEILPGTSAVGSLVSASVERLPDDTFRAVKIALDELPSEEEPTRIVGIPTSIVQEWTVRGVGGPIAVDETTDVQLGADQTGLTVLIGYEFEPDGSLIARKIRVQ